MADEQCDNQGEGREAAEAVTWRRALMASHVFRSILAVVLVAAGVVVYAASMK